MAHRKSPKSATAGTNVLKTASLIKGTAYGHGLVIEIGCLNGTKEQRCTRYR